MGKTTKAEKTAAQWQRDMEFLVERLILKRIVRPAGFDHIRAHRVGSCRYRVNVLVKKQLPDCIHQTLEVAQSWFVRSDGESISESTPELGKS